MTDTNKLEKWAFPFKTAGAASAEVSDPQLYYDALAKANNGFYPMGANGLWHGGVHFDASTGALLDQSSVRCIADGEVIAYRIDERYPTSQYGEGPAVVHLPFSTGFVLVKHRLELPPVPVATSTTATTATTTATPAPAPVAEALAFYSLYMHLLDWNGYSAPEAPTPAAFLAPSLYTVSTRPTDPQVGLRVRKEASGGSTEVLALLPKGCKVTLGIADPLKPDWKPLLSIDVGAAIPPLASGVSGWVYSPQLTGNTVADSAIDDEPALTLSHQGLNVRKEGKLTGAIIGVLPQGAKLRVGPKQTSGYCKLLEVLDYHGVPALPNGPDGKLFGYVYHADLDTSLTPPQFNAVTLLTAPAPIKAGELIGHLGQYQDHDEATPRVMLHLEVFSCDDVPAFITKSQALAASLPDSAKTLLQVQPGTKLVTHATSMCAATPPTVSDPGSTIGVTRIIPLAVLNSLPAERKIQTSTPMAGGAPIVTQWWHLDNAFADAGGNLISGWLADVIPTRHSPWEWLGFDFISETTSASEQLANHLAGQCLLSEAELPDYQMHISTADNGPIKARLYDIIDGADGTTRNEKLSVAEIRAALGKPWHAQSISQLISHYESEWYWQDAKWDELDKLMEHTPATPNTDWVAEKARIKTLSWWNKVEGQHGVKARGMAWHFHAAAMTANFHKKTSNLITIKMLKKAKPNVSENYYNSILTYLNKYAQTYEINTPLRLAHFLSQVGHESGFLVTSENLNYSATRMRQVFGCRNNISGYNTTTNECILLPRLRPKLWTEENKYAHNAENLANYVYANRTDLGNGDENSGDGYKYRGRGIIQLTGKNNYDNYTRIHNEKNPSDPQSFLDNPDLITSNLDYGIESAFAWWNINRLNSRIQDSYNLRTESNISGHVADISTIVNGGTIGLTERTELFNSLRTIIKEEYSL